VIPTKIGIEARVIHDGNGVDIFPSAGFASFFSHWGRAMRRQNWLHARGRRNVHIVAFSTAGISTIFDAYKVARALGYPNGGFDNRRKLWNHRDEFLVYGAVHFENYAILAIFPGDINERRITLQSSSHTVNVMVPAVFTSGLERGRETNELRIQIYQYTGVFDEGRLDMLVRHMGGLV
jgi:hypothetical protein